MKRNDIVKSAPYCAGNILITGGAGNLGAACADHFARNGYRVFSLDIRERENAPDGVVQLIADVRDMAAVHAAVERIAGYTDTLNALISFAGVYAMDSFVEIDEAQLIRALDINLMGCWRTVKCALPLLISSGRIIIITSELARQKPLPFNGIYSLTKCALDHYADSLRLELGLIGVPVITVRPGAFGGDMAMESERAMQRMAEKTRLYRHNTRRFYAVMRSQTGTARPPERLAKTIFRAFSARRPRPVYTPNPGLLLKLYSALPRRLQLFALRLLLK